jgi:8-oxo-dGTP diphosphatase
MEHMRNRLYPNHPIVGVGVLIEKAGKYLLIKRAAEPDKELWSIPGGLVEIGERVVDAAAREVLEETNLTVNIGERIGVIDKIIKDEEGKAKYHFVIIDFMATLINGKLQARDDALEAKWVDPNEFQRYDLSPTLKTLLINQDLYPSS